MATTYEPRTRIELEARAGVDSSEERQDIRRQLVEEDAPLRAEYENRDAIRKAKRSERANQIAADLTRERGKAPSEAEVERLAAGDAETLRDLREAQERHARHFVLQDRIQAITELLNRDQALIRFVTSEPKV